MPPGLRAAGEGFEPSRQPQRLSSCFQGSRVRPLRHPAGRREYIAGFDAVLTPGDIILLTSWKNREAADAFVSAIVLPDGARIRLIRVVRDYGMFDRREAPQYFPDVKKH